MIRKILLAIFIFIFAGTCSLHAESTPKSYNGKKFRIGYYEGGPFSDYTDTMRTFIEGLMELGWIHRGTVPEYYEEQPKTFWDWLSHWNSPYLSFKPEDGYSALWDSSRREKIKQELLGKLQSDKLDLVIAMGTWAGQDLANNLHSVPVMVMSTSNPVEAGIIQSAKSSGYPHVTARVDTNRYLRQIRMFHRIVGFKTLGIAFENTPDGRIYSAINKIEQVARERGFKPVYCEVVDTTTDIEKSDASSMECYRKLAESTDAVYITALTCVDRIPDKIADLFRQSKTPTFSMVGSKFVKAGFLLSISSDSGYKALGQYYAEKFGAILNGAKPIDLEQEFEDPLDIAVNLKTAESIGFTVPQSLLKIATELYE